MSFYNFFLCGQPYRFRDISQTSELKSIIASTWFIHFDRLCNYLHSFRNSQPPISLKITAASLFRNALAIISTNLLKIGHGFFIKYLLRPDLMRILLPRSYILLSLVGVVVVAIVVVVAELVVVAVGVVIVLVAVVVVLKYWPGQVNTNGGP